MKRLDALGTIVKALKGDEAVIATLGLISRELYENFDSENNFYMVGSMGLASSIGIGVALSRPKKRVVVIDGDGSVLMNLGSMATIGHTSPRNLTHVVLDNHAYASCAEEASITTTTRLDDVARVVGYRYVRQTNTEADLHAALMESAYYGPSFILAEIELGGKLHPARVLSLLQIKYRFRKSISAEIRVAPILDDIGVTSP
jgi:thiamine pyrophosphate-dependent acetolactate synthase large subunit-like protein